jgi:hypothetical protein
MEIVRDILALIGALGIAFIAGMLVVFALMQRREARRGAAAEPAAPAMDNVVRLEDVARRIS